MHHMLLKLPVDRLRVSPFQPASTAAQGIRSEKLDSLFPHSVDVLMPPLIGGFAGSDALSCLLYFGFDVTREPMLAVDLGTNGEVMVTDTRRIVVATAPAGPAFEGVNITCGTRAVPGAIVSADVREDGEIEVTTIGDEPPIGVSGSGLLSLVKGFYRVGLIAQSGRIVANHPTFGSRVTEDADGKRVFIADGISLTQGDIRQLQMAKAAILSAAEAVIERIGLRPGDLSRVVFTGSFGSQVGVDDVLGLRMIPPVKPEIVESFANGAGLGAALFFDDDLRRRGEAIASMAEHVELFAEPEFMDRFVQAMPF